MTWTAGASPAGPTPCGVTPKPKPKPSKATARPSTSPTPHPKRPSSNQGQLLWQGLENYLLGNGATYQGRLVVFTGPVLDPTDPPYRGAQIPLLFYKVAAFIDGDQAGTDLAATGYVLSQTPLIDHLPEALDRAQTAGQPPPLGPFRTFQVPITDIAGLTGLALDQLVAVDRLDAAAPSARTSASGGWAPLHTFDDISW